MRPREYPLLTVLTVLTVLADSAGGMTAPSAPASDRVGVGQPAKEQSSMSAPMEIAALLGAMWPYFKYRWLVLGKEAAQFREFHDSTRSLFIHIPKTAGLSVYKSIYESETLHGHPPALAFESRDPAKFADYFKFSFLRHPVDRFASGFFYLKSGGLTLEDRLWSENNLAPFETPGELLQAMARPRIRASILCCRIFIPQHFFLRSSRQPNAMDFVGRTENFDTDLQLIADRFGMPYRPAVRNRSSRPDSMGFSRHETGLIERFYSQDFELYETGN
jgi:hypothetical protein